MPLEAAESGNASCARKALTAYLRDVQSTRTLRMQFRNIREAREARGETLANVAAACGTDPGNLSRIERGEQIPAKELARRLYEHFAESVELGAIFDPEHFAA